jgi:hypothetical protein
MKGREREREREGSHSRVGRQPINVASGPAKKKPFQSSDFYIGNIKEVSFLLFFFFFFILFYE